MMSIIFAILNIVHAEKNGISFVVVGDFGNIKEFERPSAVFDAISMMKENAEKDSSEDFEFFITTGDNLYPIEPENPSEDEFEKVMSLFSSRDAIKDLPIYPVRGNHDCIFDDNLEIEIASKYPNWKMNTLFYEKQF